ncbi:MAG TPA: hypothetical protein VFM49_13190 [Chloroflexia bacterium]|jgi:hypothetical protein|nr:hypothetical protein [Chloroflexia bacterium]
MDEELRFTEADIQAAHRDRARGEYGADEEPLYGLEALPGGHGEAPIEESVAEEAESEAGRPGEQPGLNLTWGIILGGVLLLVLITAVLFIGVGQTYQADIVTHYPVK